MDENKKSVPAPPELSTQTNNSPAVIIPQKRGNNQAQNKKSSKPDKRPLCIDSRVCTIALKFYDEQLPYGWDETCRRIRNVDKSKMQILGIRHDKDIITDGIWVSSLEKPHCHIEGRCTNKEKRFYVKDFLDMLGVYYRPGLDDDLWRGHGVETAGNFTGYAVYLTHQTEKAIADGKELYDVSEIISNLTPDEVSQVRDGYIRVSDKSTRLTTTELEALDKDAFELGYNMKNFQAWYSAQPFTVRSNAKMKIIRESYDRGVEARIEEQRDINRVCIFIKGSPDTGKTYAAEQALAGKQILSVNGGGTGKFDRLRPDHNAIIVDDDVCPNLLNMTDNYICRAYKRNSNNPAWAGEYFIVTSNLKFDEWVTSCGVKIHDNYGRPTQHYDAVCSRFFICQLVNENGVNHLALASPSTRGSVEKQTARANKFMEFKQSFDKVISTYVPGNNKVDFSNIIESTPYVKIY